MISRPANALALDRILPNSLEAEMATLGSMMLDPQAADRVMEKLADPAMFYYAAHQQIYGELCAMMDATKAVDMVTLTQRLQDKGRLDEIGGAAYLADLVSRVPTTANVDHYIGIVRDKHILRMLIAAAHDTVSQAFERQEDVEQILAETMLKVQVMAEGSTDGGFVKVEELVKETMRVIEQMMQNRGALTGLATGFRDFDRLTGGLHGGEMCIIAARPSTGKTSLAMNIAEYVSIDLNIPVGVFSLEMSKEELTKRMVSCRARVNLKSISEGFSSERDFPKLTTAASELMKAPLYIDDTASLTLAKMRARARRLKKSKDIQLLVVDYLQLMKCPGKQSDSNRQVEVSNIAEGVKAILKELKIPGIIVAQLNRKPDEREGGRPKLSDLRESGSIEQAADIVGLLVRPEMNTDDPEKKAAERGRATLIIAKNRNGPTGDAELTFLHEYTRFEQAARVSDSDVPQGYDQQ